MTIETKYNIGDMVFVLFLNKIYEIEILKIEIIVKTNTFHYQDESTILYTTSTVENEVWQKKQSKFYENEIFSTKQELLNSL